MRNFITAASEPGSSNSSAQIKVRAFNADTRQWQWQAPAWLREMQSGGLGCSAIHTLQIEEGGRVAVFHVFVAEPMPNLPPVPTKITDCWEAGSQLGNAVIADFSQDPPSIKVHKDFWAGPSEGASHFEDTILPLMEKIMADFCERGELWAS